MTKSVLFVDDDIEITEIMKDVFEDASLELCVFNDPLSALSYLKKHDVSLILTDLKMPEMDGFEFFQKVKSTKNQNVQVILVSGHIEETMKEKAQALGFSEIVEKPFDMDEFVGLVNQYLES